MAERKIVVVSELAPRLREFEAGAARRFLKEYVAYENRLEASEAQVPLKRCIEPEDLDTLMQCSEDMVGVRVIKKMPEGVDEARRNRVRVNIAPVTPRALAVEMDSEDEGGEEGAGGEESVEGETVPEGDPEVLYLSNAHIEMMLVHALGPADEAEASDILRAVKMPRDPPFSKLSTATSFVRDWKDAMRWCLRWLPRDKILTKFFLANVQPKKLAYSLENTGVKRIGEVMNLFLQAYRKGVNAKKTLAGMDALHEPEAKPVAAPSRPPAPAAASKAAGATPVANAKDWKASKTCFFCGKTGHIKPDCPEKKKAEAKGVKMGVLQMRFTHRWFCIGFSGRVRVFRENGPAEWVLAISCAPREPGIFSFFSLGSHVSVSGCRDGFCGLFVFCAEDDVQTFL